MTHTQSQLNSHLMPLPHQELTTHLTGVLGYRPGEFHYRPDGSIITSTDGLTGEQIQQFLAIVAHWQYHATYDHFEPEGVTLSPQANEVTVFRSY